MLKKSTATFLLLCYLYPVLSLWAQNVQEVSPSQVYRALFFSVLFGFLLWLALWLIFRQWEKAALVGVVVYLLIFSYGHIYNSLDQWNENLARHRYILPIYAILMVAWGVIVFRNNKSVERWVSFLKVIGPALLIMPVFNLGSYLIIDLTREKQPAPTVVTTETSGQRPDIYYIILDGYGRADTLDKYYGYDNSSFISFLKDQGFYVAEASRSNYISTVLSLSSSLNMQYVNELLPEAEPHTSDLTQLAGYHEDLLDLLRHNYVRKFLAQHGYRFVTYDNHFKTTAHDADVLLSYSPLAGHGESESGLVINGFEGLLLETSMARLWVDWQVARGGENIVIEAPYVTHRALTLDMFQSLKEIPGMEGDNFVFMHFLVPHPPFVFGPNGENIRHDQSFSLADGVNYPGSSRSYIRGYADQVTYINQYLEEVVTYLIENSQPQPVIIIQGDHGPRTALNFKNPKLEDLDSIFGNLNAYYLPNTDNAMLYPTITPVNTFRIVLNTYFGQEFELLPDQNFLSTSEQPLNFSNVTELIK